MQNHFSIRFYTLIVAVIMAVSVNAQQQSAQEKALIFLRENPSKFDLTAKDVAALRITDSYVDANNGVTHVWLQQEYAGIPVYNALIGLHVKPNGTVRYLSHRLVAELAEKTNTTLPSLSAEQALQLAMNQIDIADRTVPRLKEKKNDQNLVFDKGTVSKADIPVQACYLPMNAGASLHLAWMIDIDQENTSDVWQIHIDAQTGEMLRKVNRTLYCSPGHLHTEEADCATPVSESPATTEGAIVANNYNVFALPVESPAHGNRILLTNPANPTASPYGWHDTDGSNGPEYTYTRGNNVWAYSDATADNNGSEVESAAGGPSLVFDYPFNPNNAPAQNINAAITNLFYTSNMAHDIFYHYGFDEAAGNFQVKNYTGTGTGNDALKAEAIDGGSVDNADFVPTPDGTSPRMQMYEWTRSGGNILSVNAPAQVNGLYYAQAAVGWGAPITTTPVTGEVILTNDGSGNPTWGCNPILNDVNGKIALIDRGTCTFAEKALNAQAAGAKACIICNFLNSTSSMGPGTVGGQVTIPVVSVSKTDCDAIRQYASQGLNITLAQPPATAGPDRLDGSFDNGIIIHEYAHGISNRLTGGASTTNCLIDQEQMGEGWSDWVAMVTTAKSTDYAGQKRGIGTYVSREPGTANGVRRYPYSTDMSVNPLTYGSVAENPGKHALGEVWCATLWDLYWAMVDKYGFDPNWENTSSGNGRAVRLVLDGMKYQPCNPGFVDGRNAIFLADEMNYNNADTCLLSLVFARRGLGLQANQGSSDDASDGTESFSPIEVCVKELKITKTTTSPIIEPGTVASFNLTVTNHKDAAVTEVIVVDEVPVGLTPFAISNSGTYAGNKITWNLGTLAQGQVVNLSYAADAVLNGSIRLYRDIMDDNNDWYVNTTEGSSEFYLQTNFKKAGTHAWRCDNLPSGTDMELIKATPLFVTGNNPVLRFWNRYNTQTGLDGGFVEFQREGSTEWLRSNKGKSFRNGYTGALAYSTFAIPLLDGFSGSSNGWVQTYFDLKEFSSDSIYVKFRFGSDGATSVDGWMFDDFEMLEMVNYDGEASVTSAQGDLAHAKVPGRGVIVNPGTTAVKDLDDRTVGMHIQPNPAANVAYITVDASITGDAFIRIAATDGRLVAQRKITGINAGEAVVFDLTGLPSGIYTVRLESNKGVGVQKLVVR